MSKVLQKAKLSKWLVDNSCQPLISNYDTILRVHRVRKDRFHKSVLSLAIIALVSTFVFSVTSCGVDEKGRWSVTGETTQSPDGYDQYVQDRQDAVDEYVDTIFNEGDLPQQPEILTEEAQTGNDIIDVDKSICPENIAYDPTQNDCLPNTAQMGASPYYDLPHSTPKEFYDSTHNLWGFDEGYGRQCVAFFKEMMYVLSHKVVATSTGGASGYANQQSQVNSLGFSWHGGRAGIQDGDWAIFSDGTYGHVAMFYAGVYWYGQNQSGGNIYAGSGPSLISSNWGNVIGYYRPNIWETPAPAPQPPAPAPQPTPVDLYAPGTKIKFVKGDTLCKVYGLGKKDCTRDKFEEIAKHLVRQNGLTVYESWNGADPQTRSANGGGYGVIAGETVIYQ